MPSAPTPAELAAHQAFLERLARGLVGDPHGADDLVQDFWVLALQRGLALESMLRTGLVRSMRGLARNAARGERRRRARERRAAEASLEAMEPRLEVHRQVVEELQRLSEPYRSTLYLRYHEELAPREIARRLELPVATVKTRLRRGLERLRTALDGRHGGDRRAWCVALVGLARVQRVAALAPIAAALAGLGLAALLVVGFAGDSPVASELAAAPASPSSSPATPAPSPAEHGLARTPREQQPVRVALATPRANAEGGATLELRVTDAAGEPVARLPITLRSPSALVTPGEGLAPFHAAATTDSLGRARFEGVPAERTLLLEPGPDARARGTWGGVSLGPGERRALELSLALERGLLLGLLSPQPAAPWKLRAGPPIRRARSGRAVRTGLPDSVVLALRDTIALHSSR